MKIMYLNVNGFYGTSNKNRAKLQIGLDDDCCKKNAQYICERIISDDLKYDVIFFSEFAPNTPSGKLMTSLLEKNGYHQVLPNASANIPVRFYSIVVAYAKKNLNITSSIPSPNKWLKWCELEIDSQHIVAIHSTGLEFLTDMNTELQNRNNNNLIVFGDTNVTEYSDEISQNLLNGIGIKEILDSDYKMTFREIRKPDRVFSNMNGIEFTVISGYFKNSLSDHDALNITYPK